MYIVIYLYIFIYIYKYYIIFYNILYLNVLSSYLLILFLSFVPYCSSNQAKNFSNDTDCTTIGIELCNIPHISEH
jgi:hypothetical protein